MPDKVTACLSQKGTQESSRSLLILWGQVLMRRWTRTAPQLPQRGRPFHFRVVRLETMAAANCISHGGSGLKPCVLLWCLERPLTSGSALQRHTCHKVFLSGLPGVKGHLQGEATTLWVLGVWVCYHHSMPMGLGISIKESLMSKSWADTGMVVMFLVYLGLENGQ